MDDVIAACRTNIGAGSDTASVSLTNILYHVISSPERLERISSFAPVCRIPSANPFAVFRFERKSTMW